MLHTNWCSCHSVTGDWLILINCSDICFKIYLFIQNLHKHCSIKNDIAVYTDALLIHRKFNCYSKIHY